MPPDPLAPLPRSLGPRMSPLFSCFSLKETRKETVPGAKTRGPEMPTTPYDFTTEGKGSCNVEIELAASSAGHSSDDHALFAQCQRRDRKSAVQPPASQRSDWTPFPYLLQCAGYPSSHPQSIPGPFFFLTRWSIRKC